MKKDDLRKVGYSLNGMPLNGYFHQWIIKKDEFGNDFAMGLIENSETGAVHEIERGVILFQD
jgi:hypothetical protein